MACSCGAVEDDVRSTKQTEVDNACLDYSYSKPIVIDVAVVFGKREKRKKIYWKRRIATKKLM